MEGGVELHGDAPVVPEEQDRRRRAAMEAHDHAEIERDLLELARGDRSLVMATLRFADEEVACGAIAEDCVRIADKAVGSQ
ncbi:MAG: hypothetical protein J4G15_11365 [Alphaproteobacteria bacterium]|nr:hypothetical protein [Alphaproteobacteria bacterium]